MARSGPPVGRRSARAGAPAAQREQLARLEELTEAPLTTLPFLFEPELGVEEIGDARRGGAHLMAGVAELLDGKRVCICAGSGGVGKTTTAAAIAAGMAARGRRSRC